jgi:hypothetical protein
MVTLLEELSFVMPDTRKIKGPFSASSGKELVHRASLKGHWRKMRLVSSYTWLSPAH